MSNSLQPMDWSMPGFPVHHYLPELFRLMSIKSVMPSKHLIFCHPLLLPPFQSFPASGSFPMSQLFTSGGLVLELQLQNQSYQWTPGLISFRMDWLDLLAVQESSPIPQFKSINSLALSFLYSPILTSTHDHWKNHSLDWMDHCCFLICCLGLS